MLLSRLSGKTEPFSLANIYTNMPIKVCLYKTLKGNFPLCKLK